MQKLPDWLIVGVLTLSVGGVAVSFTGGVNAALLGGSVAALSVSVVSRNKDIRLRQLEAQVLEKENYKILEARKPILEKRVEELTSEVTELQTRQRHLAAAEGQFIQKRAELQQVDQRITTLKEQHQELENRIAVINRQNPDLSHLEQLTEKVEKLKIDKSGLEGQIQALTSQVEALESQRINLQGIESELIGKEKELDSLTTRVQQLQNQTQQLEQRATELELLRITYDGIFSQKESFEARVNQLRPEIERLESEKQRILQAIQESQNEYHRCEELRQKLHGLRIAIRDKESELKQVERETQSLQGIKTTLEEKTQILKAEISRLNGEIKDIENSAKLALESLTKKLWKQLPNTKFQPVESEFLRKFITDINSQGLTFSTRVINAFHTSLKVQDISALVILAGISGTGKSELPQRYSNYIGAQLLTLAVQPRWDSPQDLQGFYNYVEKKFKPTDLMRGLYQYNKYQDMKDRIVVVLLDEMNLARVEYYFSEFLSKLETRRNEATYLEIDVGSLSIDEDERRLQIPNAFLFVGTMNEDETTQTLSDKVLDRANVLTFGKPQNLKLRQDNRVPNSIHESPRYVPYSHFKTWIKEPDPNSENVRKVKHFLNQANEVMEKMGHPFAHRVYQAITQYVINYPGVDNIDSQAFKFALADQFGQKLLPKLRGIMLDEAREQLDELEVIIQEIDDIPLTKAFQKAREGRYGQFSWQGLVYQDE